MLHHAVVTAAEAEFFEEALQRCVDAVCELTSWPVGHVYLVPEVRADDGDADAEDREKELTPTKIWYVDESGSYDVGRQVTERSTFVANHRQSTEEAKANDMGPRLNILLAEDGRINQQVALGLLKMRGYDVVIANDGKEAVDALEKQPFDVVLMDVQMPEMDGFEATAVIREREAQIGKHTPIVAMTANAMKGDRERCLAAGMDGYVAKPVEREQLFNAIDKAVAAHSDAPRNARRASDWRCSSTATWCTHTERFSRHICRPTCCGGGVTT